MASARFPKRVWAQWCSALVWDLELWPPGAHLTAGGPGALSWEASTRKLSRWNSGQRCTCDVSDNSHTHTSSPRDVCRGQSRVGAPDVQHRLHLWAVCLCSHSAGQQRVSAAVQGWRPAHPVYQQVCPYTLWGTFMHPLGLIKTVDFCAVYTENWTWTARCRKRNATSITTARVVPGIIWTDAAERTQTHRKTSSITSVAYSF